MHSVVQACHLQSRLHSVQLDNLLSVCQLFMRQHVLCGCLWCPHDKVMKAPLLKLCSSSMCHGRWELKAFASVAHTLQACGSFHTQSDGRQSGMVAEWNTASTFVMRWLSQTDVELFGSTL